MDKSRYEDIQVNGITYVFDHFNKIVLPKFETMDFYMNHLKGSPLLRVRPEEEMTKFIEDRIKFLKENFDSHEKYRFEDKSEEYLSNIDDNTSNKYVILSIDMVGSTALSIEIPQNEYSSIVKTYTKEMDFVIKNYHGLILKHVDGILAFFPVPAFWGAEDISIDCAVAMKRVIEEGINPVLKKNNISSINFKIGLDFGEVAVNDLGTRGIKMHKDLLGKTINIVAKIQAAGESGDIIIGQNLLQRLHVSRRKMFQQFPKDWKYTLANDGKIYSIYKLIL